MRGAMFGASFFTGTTTERSGAMGGGR
jgi:hypothetical protein